jgi:hypothetical protein
MAPTLQIIAPQLYPYVLAGLAANFFFQMVLNPIIGLKARKMTMTKDFLGQFEEEHAKAFPGGNVDGLGQPD